MAAIDSVLWWPTGRHDKLVSIDEQNLCLWSLDASKKTAQVRQTLDCRLCVAYHIYIIVFERSHRHQKQVPWPFFLHLMSSVLYFRFNFLHLNAVLASQPFDIELGVTELGREPNVYI